MIIQLSDNEESLTLNYEAPASQDAMWVVHCERWHPYWLQRTMYCVSCVQLSQNGRTAWLAADASSLLECSEHVADCAQFEHLKTLNLSCTSTASVWLSGLSGLRHLDVSFTKIRDLDLRQSPGLTNVIACECPYLRGVLIGSLRDLQQFVIVGADLAFLDMQNARFPAHLNLCGTKIGVFTPFSDSIPYSRPVFLDVQGACAEQLKACDLTNITYLGLSRSSLRELPNVGASIECLDISHTFISEILPLPALKALYCEGCPLQQFVLSDFPELEEANFNSTSVDSLDLTGGAHLQVLRLSYTLVFELDLSCFEGKLRELDVSESEICRLEWPSLQHLEYLDIYRCAIAKIDTSFTPKLHTLLARSSSLFECNFTALTALQVCDISFTQVQMADIRECSQLREFKAQGTSIARLDCRKLAHLETLCMGEGCEVLPFEQSQYQPEPGPKNDNYYH